MIQLPIDGVLRDFVDVQTYRKLHHLPNSFGVNTFEPKSYDGLGSIAHAGDVLRTMKDHFLSEMPDFASPQKWLLLQDQEQARFRSLLVETNTQVGLREPEIDFAVAGFVNVYSQWVYVLFHAKATHTPPKSFDEIYHAWLHESVRVASQIYHYKHSVDVWQVKIISHVYGRIGLQIQRGDIVEHVYDHNLACPAEHFMRSFMSDVAAHIQSACNI
jgi:hypothetical protein